MKEEKAKQENQGDYLVRGVAAEGSILIMAAVATRLADEARWRHGTAPVATAALGRTLTAAAMMGAALKRNERVLLQICGDGPLGKVVAEADASGHVRGYVSHPHVDLPSTPEGKLNVGRGVGNRGTLYVIRDLGLKEPYIGSVPLVSGEIAKDLTYYFARSEQIPTSVALGVLVETDGSVRAAGGLIVHLLPGHPPELVDQLEQNLAHLPPVSSLVDEGAKPEDLVAVALGGMPFQELGRLPLRFTCDCSVERLERILVTLGREELDEMVREGQAEIICRFCGQRYLFDQAHLERLRDEALNPPEQRWKH